MSIIKDFTDLKVYNLAENLANKIWKIVIIGITLKKFHWANNSSMQLIRSLLILQRVLEDIIIKINRGSYKKHR